MPPGCPPGYAWDKKKQRCVRKDAAKNLPGVQVKNPAGRGSGGKAGENPQGACPTGYVWDVKTRKCVRRAGSDAKPGQGCPPGYYWDAQAKRCKQKKADPGICPTGYVWNARQGACVQDKTCPEGMVFKDGKCQFPEQGACPEGYHLVDGKCVPSQRGDCPQGYKWDPQAKRCVVDLDNPPPEEPGDEPSEEEPEGAPPRPDYSPGTGNEWVWNPDTNQWEAKPTQATQNDILSRLTEIVDFWGINNEDTQNILKDALKYGWSENTFRMNLRKSSGYLANPLFAANVERAKQGKGWMDETQVIAWGDAARNMAKRYGYDAPSNNYLAMGLVSGLSVAEVEHRLTIQDRINRYGGGVKAVAQMLGLDTDDETLFKVFDNENFSTQKWEDTFRHAQMRGLPMLYGLGIRSQAEAEALDMLGITPEQAMQGYQKLAGALPSIDKFARIDAAIRDDPENPFDSFGALFNDIFRNDPASAEAIMLMTAREQARFRQGGATPQQGQLVGLLSGEEKQTYS